jgi:hypothetical protein
MEWSDYVMERVAAARLGELRAQSARFRLLRRLRGPRPGALPVLGRALIQLGRWLARDTRRWSGMEACGWPGCGSMLAAGQRRAPGHGGDALRSAGAGPR